MVIKPKKAPLVIHVNSHNIRANRKYWGFPLRTVPVITVRYGRGAIATRCNGLEILGPSRLVYDRPKSLSCGAEVWIETDASVDTITWNVGEDGD